MSAAESRCCCCSCCPCCCRVCPLLLLQRFLSQPEIPVETAVRVYRRYLQLEPTHAEEFIAYLKSKVRTHTHPLLSAETTHQAKELQVMGTAGAARAHKSTLAWWRDAFGDSRHGGREPTMTAAGQVRRQAFSVGTPVAPVSSILSTAYVLTGLACMPRQYCRLTEKTTLCHPPQERWGEAARRLANVLNDDTFRSIEGKSKHQLWLELCDLITKHPADVIKERIDVDAILRGGIRKYKDEVGV